MDASNDVTSEVAKSEFADALAELIDGEQVSLDGLTIAGTDVDGSTMLIILSNGQRFRAVIDYAGE
jgi:hypothetical protein